MMEFFNTNPGNKWAFLAPFTYLDQNRSANSKFGESGVMHLNVVIDGKGRIAYIHSGALATPAQFEELSEAIRQALKKFHLDEISDLLKFADSEYFHYICRIFEVQLKIILSMSEYIPRILSRKIEESAKFFPVIVVSGPRQSGKTSLCRHLYPEYRYVNLENITARANAAEDPTLFLESLGNEVIIDEVQHVPELLSMIQVRVDEDKSLRYILTGSSNFSLLRSVTQSLAGRVALFTLLPLSFKEMSEKELAKPISELMWRGEYPRVIAEGVPPYDFYQNYYNTYVERDLRDLLKLRNILSFDKFVRLLAIRTGSEFNASALAREVGVSSNTISEWLSLLATSYIAYSLQPYLSNLSKRLTKMPKVYFYDTGLLCFLLGIEDYGQLEDHPLKGAIFENLAMGELLKSRYNIGREPNLYFYREQSGLEVDAIMLEGASLHLYEIKAGKTLRKDFMENMNLLKSKINDISISTVIYDGESFPPQTLNIRDI